MIVPKYTARQRLKELEDQLTRLDPKKREVYYLTIDPVLMAKAEALLDGALSDGTTMKDSDESEKPS